MNAVRRLLYNSNSLMRENFVLVEMPSTLYAGFYWTLTHLQNQSKAGKDLAFLSSIAPSIADASPQVSPPGYSAVDDFAFQLDTLRKPGVDHTKGLILRPKDLLSKDATQGEFIDNLCSETTLDRGQAQALCENLCRGFAFTQGPPGTGKT